MSGIAVPAGVPPIRRSDGDLPALWHIYGARRVLSDYLGEEIPPTHGDLTWQHGWIARNRQHHPATVIHDRPRPGRTALVARVDEQEYLRALGLPARAVGLPFVYAVANRGAPDRAPGSLLVVPRHSSALKRLDRRESVSGFFHAAVAAAGDFPRRSVLLHEHDWDRPSVLADWRQGGFTPLPGACDADENTLYRIVHLLARHETVFVEGAHSSAIVYAAALGARVVVLPSPPPAHVSLGTEIHDETGARPVVMEDEVAEMVRPVSEARHHVGFGRSQSGFENRLDPVEFREFLTEIAARAGARRPPLRSSLLRRLVSGPRRHGGSGRRG